jgi:hypothetical protein
MPAPLDYGSTDYTDGYQNPLAAPRVFRRRTTLITSVIFAVVPLIIAGFILPREVSHGALDIVATIWGALTLSLFALVMGVWPHVTLGPERMQVHNSFFWFDVPYVSVSQMSPTHMGVVVRTHAGKVIAVAAYASGSGRRIFSHKDAAEELKRAVEERTAYVDDTAWKTAPAPERHANWLNIIGLSGAVVIAVLLIVLGVN